MDDLDDLFGPPSASKTSSKSLSSKTPSKTDDLLDDLFAAAPAAPGAGGGSAGAVNTGAASNTGVNNNAGVADLFGETTSGGGMNNASAGTNSSTTTKARTLTDDLFAPASRTNAGTNASAERTSTSAPVSGGSDKFVDDEALLDNVHQLLAGIDLDGLDGGPTTTTKSGGNEATVTSGGNNSNPSGNNNSDPLAGLSAGVGSGVTAAITADANSISAITKETVVAPAGADLAQQSTCADSLGATSQTVAESNNTPKEDVQNNVLVPVKQNVNTTNVNANMSKSTATGRNSRPNSPPTASSSTRTSSTPSGTAQGKSESSQIVAVARNKLSFRHDMWDRFEFLCHTKLESSRRSLENFTNMLVQLVQIETHYATSLERLAGKYSSFGGQPGSLSTPGKTPKKSVLPASLFGVGSGSSSKSGSSASGNPLGNSSSGSTAAKSNPVQNLLGKLTGGKQLTPEEQERVFLQEEEAERTRKKEEAERITSGADGAAPSTSKTTDPTNASGATSPAAANAESGGANESSPTKSKSSVGGKSDTKSKTSEGQTVSTVSTVVGTPAAGSPGAPPPPPKESGIEIAAYAIRSMVLNRADQGKILVEQLQSDVIEMLQSMLTQHREVYKKIVEDGRRITRLKRAQMDRFQLFRAKYKEASLKAEKMIQTNTLINLDPSLITASERSKLCVKTLDVIKRGYILEEEYALSAQEAKKTLMQYNVDMGIILDALQDMEEKRGHCFRDAAMRLLVYQTSWSRNLQYDIEGIFKTCEDIDPEAELQEFLESEIDNTSTTLLALQAETANASNSASADGNAEAGADTATADAPTSENKVPTSPAESSIVPARPRVLSSTVFPEFIPYESLVEKHEQPVPPSPPRAMLPHLVELRQIVTCELLRHQNYEILTTSNFLQNLRQEGSFRCLFFEYMSEEMRSRGMKRWRICTDAKSKREVLKQDVLKDGPEDGMSPAKNDSVVVDGDDHGSPTSKDAPSNNKDIVIRTGAESDSNTNASSKAVTTAAGGDGSSTTSAAGSPDASDDSAVAQNWDVFVGCVLTSLDSIEEQWDMWSAKNLLDVITKVELWGFRQVKGRSGSGSGDATENNTNNSSEKAGDANTAKNGGTSVKNEPRMKFALTEMLVGRVYHHRLWNRPTFWEALLYVRLSEMWQSFLNKRREGGSSTSVATDDVQEIHGGTSNSSSLLRDAKPWEVYPGLVENLLTFGRQMQLFGIKRDEIFNLYSKAIRSNCDHLRPDIQEDYLVTVKTKFVDSDPTLRNLPADEKAAIIAGDQIPLGPAGAAGNTAGNAGNTSGSGTSTTSSDATAGSKPPPPPPAVGEAAQSTATSAPPPPPPPRHGENANTDLLNPPEVGGLGLDDASPKKATAAQSQSISSKTIPAGPQAPDVDSVGLIPGGSLRGSTAGPSFWSKTFSGVPSGDLSAVVFTGLTTGVSVISTAVNAAPSVLQNTNFLGSTSQQGSSGYAKESLLGGLRSPVTPTSGGSTGVVAAGSSASGVGGNVGGDTNSSSNSGDSSSFTVNEDGDLVVEQRQPPPPPPPDVTLPAPGSNSTTAAPGTPGPQTFDISSPKEGQEGGADAYSAGVESSQIASQKLLSMTPQKQGDIASLLKSANSPQQVNANAGDIRSLASEPPGMTPNPSAGTEGATIGMGLSAVSGSAGADADSSNSTTTTTTSGPPADTAALTKKVEEPMILDMSSMISASGSSSASKPPPPPPKRSSFRTSWDTPIVDSNSNTQPGSSASAGASQPGSSATPSSSGSSEQKTSVVLGNLWSGLSSAVGSTVNKAGASITAGVKNIQVSLEASKKADADLMDLNNASGTTSASGAGSGAAGGPGAIRSSADADLDLDKFLNGTGNDPHDDLRNYGRDETSNTTNRGNTPNSSNTPGSSSQGIVLGGALLDGGSPKHSAASAPATVVETDLLGGGGAETVTSGGAANSVVGDNNIAGESDIPVQRNISDDLADLMGDGLSAKAKPARADEVQTATAIATGTAYTGPDVFQIDLSGLGKK